MTWLGKVFNFLVWLLNKVVLTIEGLPFSLTKGIYINWLDVCLLYGFIISITLFLIRKRGFYLILSLVSVLFFFSNRLFINYQNLTTKEMLVYSDKDNLIVQFRDGSSSTWLTSSKCAHLDKFIQVATDAGQYKFNKVLIIDILQKQSRFEGMMLNRNLWMKGNFIQFYDKRIAISDLSEIQVSKKSTISVDYLLIKDVKIAKKQSLNEMYSVKCLILPSSISNYKARKVEKIMEKGRAKLHRIADSGAFILKF